MTRRMNGRVLDCYLEAIPMEETSVEAALRKVLLRFKLPGEAQKIDRLMERFARHYHRRNPTVFAKDDTAYVLAFSMVLLNTDLHNPNNPYRMSKESFIANSRGIDDGCDLPAALLSVRLHSHALNLLGYLRCNCQERADDRERRSL